MKSALCLLSGKSCARLIEMFIRQIYRDEKEEGGRAAPQDLTKPASVRQGAPWGRTPSSPEGTGVGAAAGQGGPGRGGATALTHGKESEGGESRAVPPEAAVTQGQ